MNQCCKCKKEINEELEICDECKEKELLKLKKINKMLSIIQAIIIIIIIIPVIFLYVESKRDNCSSDNIKNMSTQEKEYLNSIWTSYEGAQTGAQVKAMICKLISNTYTYQDEIDKVVELKYIQDSSKNVIIDYIGKEYLIEHMSKLNDLYNKIDEEHVYNIELDYNNLSLVSCINIIY
ncbi:MAG: hypothetical protein ACI4UE_02015 [Candidatus Scatovivens sp.]